MHDDDLTAGGLEIGPPAEWLTYLNPAHQRTEHDFFWSIIAAMLDDMPGGYDDLPEWTTEFATSLLRTNQPMEGTK